MADVFPSCARADPERAKTVVNLLGRRGLAVWWDSARIRSREKVSALVQRIEDLAAATLGLRRFVTRAATVPVVAITALAGAVVRDATPPVDAPHATEAAGSPGSSPDAATAEARLPQDAIRRSSASRTGAPTRAGRALVLGSPGHTSRGST